MFHPLWREQALSGLAEPFDLVVIGGGITGCGVLLDAAQRGLRALLVERGDVASGTSSRSSKLIHGGLRYLKRMQLRTTRVSSRERDLLLATSPHLVEPIRFVYPIYQGDDTPGWLVDLGLRLYDRLGGSPRSRTELPASELAHLAPGLPTAGLDRTLGYRDARTDDARLTLAVAATAFAYGGLVWTRAEVLEGERDARGRLAALAVRDSETGSVHRVEGEVIVNAAGVWVDRVRHRLGADGDRIRPSRGSHLIFAREDLPLEAAVTLPSPDDGRPVFFIPHAEGTLVGTTDLYHQGGLDDPRPSREEVVYLLAAVTRAFPERGLRRRDVRGAFAGLRPILDTGAGEPSDASREEEIWEEEGLLSVAGGKLTTWRRMAEEVTDRAVQLLPPERQRAVAPTATRGTPLGALAPPDLARRLAAVHALPAAVAVALARRLGSLAWIACSGAAEGELVPLVAGGDLTAAEVRTHLRHGAVVRLEDLLLRRARVGMWNPDLARALVPRVEGILRRELGWSARRWQREEEAFAAALTAWTPEGVAPDRGAS